MRIDAVHTMKTNAIFPIVPVISYNLSRSIDLEQRIRADELPNLRVIVAGVHVDQPAGVTEERSADLQKTADRRSADNDPRFSANPRFLIM